MNELSFHYKTRVAANTLFPFARDERTGQRIFLPGNDNLEAGDTYYDESKHKGHLVCADCDARVHAVKDAGIIAGSNMIGNAAHFQTNENSGHADDCDIGRRQRKYRPSPKPDPTLGLVINMNVLDRNLDEDSYDLKRSFNHEAAAKYKGMERVSIRSSQQLVELMKSTSQERLDKSFVMFGDQEIPWTRFMISYDDKAESFRRLVRNMLANGEPLQSVFIDFNGEKEPRGSREQDTGRMIKMKATHLKDDENGFKHFIVPRIFIPHDQDNRVRVPFMGGSADVMVMGGARLTMETSKELSRVFYYLTFNLHDPRQIVETSLQEIGEARRNRGVKAAIGAQNQPNI